MHEGPMIARRICQLALLISSALLVGTNASAGNAPAILWADSLDKAIEQAQLRNVPIIAIYLDDKDADCKKMRAGAFQNPKFVEYVNELAIAIVGQAG